jgi:hypothetical protein
MAVGDTNLFFNRDTKVYLEQGAVIWELPVLNGYSFSQATNSSNVTLSEMSDTSGRSRRGQKVFNDSLAPAEWSFDIYARPTVVSSVHRAPEEALWNSLFGSRNFIVDNNVTGMAISAVTAAQIGTSGTYTIVLTVPSDATTKIGIGDAVHVSGISATNAPNGTFPVTAVTSTSITYVAPLAGAMGTTTLTGAIARSGAAASTNAAIDFSPVGSNKSSLATFNLYFVLGGNNTATANFAEDDVTTIYKITECCVNEATMNFEIDGIAMVSWSGMGKRIEEVTTFDATSALRIGITATDNMIRNRLTSAALVGISPSQVNKTYGITLTGGSITISNNMTFLTPESIGVVNTPLAHITGGRSVTGSLTCYADELDNGSIELYEDLLLATTATTNQFTLAIDVGGGVAPYVLFDMGQCHLEVPSINIDDVIGFEINFTALPSTISKTDELTKIRYVGV